MYYRLSETGWGQMNYQADVCIVGAGPGGALLAYLLAQKNVSVILLERHSEIAREFRGEHLNEEGEAILKKYGLFDAVEKLGLLRMEQIEYWNQGKLEKKILPDPKVGHLGIHVPQTHLLTVILEEAKKLEHFTLLLNTSVKHLLEDDSGRVYGVKAVMDGQEIIVRSELVIGADGRYSTVRKQADIDVTVRKHGYDLLWAKIPAPEGWEPSIKMALVNGYQLSLFSQAGGFVQIGWNIEEGSYPELRKQPFKPFIEQLIQAFPSLEQSVSQHIQAWKDFVFLDVHSSEVEFWGKEGVALIGDAAHTMTPTGAFGLNSALKDADTLAQFISKDKIEELGLISCAMMRKKEVAKLQAIQIEKEQSFASQFVVLGGLV